ncbi:MAG: hypothetical protein VYA34_13635 [Myxococcota bacterium]|nr:hypothetical protein [Myxococcota bacterium]
MRTDAICIVVDVARESLPQKLGEILGDAYQVYSFSEPSSFLSACISQAPVIGILDGSVLEDVGAFLELAGHLPQIRQMGLMLMNTDEEVLDRESHFLRVVPVEPDCHKLASKILTLHSDMTARGKQSSGLGVRGAIKGVSVVDILQLLYNSRQSVDLECFGDSGLLGSLSLADGEFKGACLRGATGLKAAMRLIVSNEVVQVTMNPGRANGALCDAPAIPQLVMMAMQAEDELAHLASEWDLNSNVLVRCELKPDPHEVIGNDIWEMLVLPMPLGTLLDRSIYSDLQVISAIRAMLAKGFIQFEKGNIETEWVLKAGVIENFKERLQVLPLSEASKQFPRVAVVAATSTSLQRLFCYLEHSSFSTSHESPVSLNSDFFSSTLVLDSQLQLEWIGMVWKSELEGALRFILEGAIGALLLAPKQGEDQSPETLGWPIDIHQITPFRVIQLDENLLEQEIIEECLKQTATLVREGEVEAK